MSCKFLLAILFSLLSLPALCVETVTVNYHYSENPGVDFSELATESFGIGTITDNRGVDKHQLINGIAINSFDSNAEYHTSKPITDLIEDALAQAFIAGGAQLGNGEEQLQLSGELIELTPTVTGEGEDATLQLTLRVKAALINTQTSKTLWQSTLFSRAKVPLTGNNIDVINAVSQGLDILIENLMYDDYFLLELLP